MTDTTPKYLIWSSYHRAWWRPERSGYTTHLASAGRYYREDALRICALARDGWGGQEVPMELPVPEADALECAHRFNIAATPAG